VRCLCVMFGEVSHAESMCCLSSFFPKPGRHVLNKCFISVINLVKRSQKTVAFECTADVCIFVFSRFQLFRCFGIISLQ